MNGNKLKINAKGLTTGLRGEQDGMWFFGTEEKNKEVKANLYLYYLGKLSKRFYIEHRFDIFT